MSLVPKRLKFILQTMKGLTSQANLVAGVVGRKVAVPGAS